ncbi:magnesium and cobalt transport protein CorA [Arthrobacter sp. S41]|uniref:magnesium and cobalt transport protein CorA n=1 Tax=Micrococcaceae TaxID=1268 RepID=UPI0010358F54|nr:magnesium and cobalt transport protein CorA [Arthrobacter sp. S41]TAP27437.1 magnesium and cobalt transport protein CorA [Arthrobacter sp. S41]
MARIQRRSSRAKYTANNQASTHSLKRVRFIDDGAVETAPADITATQALEFSQTGDNRIALSLYPTPNEADIQELTEAWNLHPVLVEDLLHARQRPKLERYGDVLLIVVRSALYLDEAETVELSEFHILVRPGSVAVFCQDHRWIDGTDGHEFAESISNGNLQQHQMLLKDPKLLRLGAEAVLYRILDEIVDGYAPVLRGLGIDKEQIESQVFGGDAAVTERIYRLSQEVVDMQHSTASLLEVVRSLDDGFSKYPVPEELQTYLQDVTDHLTRANTQALEYREALSQILNVNATLVAQRQNEDMKKISGWAAILFAPTLIAAIYGMNFDNMPELHWSFGYPGAVLFMVVFAAALYGVFKWRKWF